MPGTHPLNPLSPITFWINFLNFTTNKPDFSQRLFKFKILFFSPLLAFSQLCKRWRSIGSRRSSWWRLPPLPSREQKEKQSSARGKPPNTQETSWDLNQTCNPLNKREKKRQRASFVCWKWEKKSHSRIAVGTSLVVRGRAGWELRG